MLITNAICSEYELTDCTPGTWMSYEPYDIDPVVPREGMYVKAGECPEWRCDAITTTLTANGCDGPFTNNTARNVWRTADGAKSFSWYEWGKRWQCQSAETVEDYGVCYQLAEAAHSEWEWTSLGGGQSTSLNMSVRSESNANEEYYETVDITCEGAPAPSPTMFPTLMGSGATARAMCVGLAITMLLVSFQM